MALLTVVLAGLALFSHTDEPAIVAASAELKANFRGRIGTKHTRYLNGYESCSSASGHSRCPVGFHLAGAGAKSHSKNCPRDRSTGFGSTTGIWYWAWADWATTLSMVGGLLAERD